MGDIPESFSPSSYLSSSCSSTSLSNHHRLSMDIGLQLMAEKSVSEILDTVLPAVVSDKRRKDVIEYIQKLIGNHYKKEVIELFPFGSVPLKTYLPDGDIDFTAITHPNTEEDLARGVCKILEAEPPDRTFRIRNVQYICAQVKVVKFSVNNIAVDISFNKRAAICSLFFLEQVNQLIGKGHLFKRSIILIKAWCFYESRVLGAHCGLISTYALETLILHVINLFHSSLHSPLQVLCRFLDYYSTFDWDNYCVSIYGPVAISALPDIVVNPENDKLLLSREVLRNCRETFSDSIKALETTCEFRVKHLNVLDPLKEDNNLGRSVSKGNFHRIKFAIMFGAKQLQEIVQLPGENLGPELENLFATTLGRNGKGLRPDAVDTVSVFGIGRCEEFDLCGDYNSYFTGPLPDHWCPDHCASLVPNQSKSSSLPPLSLRSPVENNSGSLFSLAPRNNITHSSLPSLSLGSPVENNSGALYSLAAKNNITHSSLPSPSPSLRSPVENNPGALYSLAPGNNITHSSLPSPSLSLSSPVENNSEALYSLAPGNNITHSSLPSPSLSLSSPVENNSGALHSLEPRDCITHTAGTNVFSLGLPVYHVYAPQFFTYGPSSYIMMTSRGTGPYIPDRNHKSYRDWRPPMKVGNHETRTRGQLQRPLRIGAQVENSREPAEGENSHCPVENNRELAEGENSHCPVKNNRELAEGENSPCPHLSLNEFPFLSGISRSTSSDVQQSSRSSVNCSQAEGRSIPFPSIDHGTSKLPSGPSI